jgi:hypothetical protein
MCSARFVGHYTRALRMLFLSERPYPETGITTSDWKKIKPTFLYLEDLVLTQQGVYLEPLLNGATRSESDECPHVVHWNGSYYLEDGHTRVARCRILGLRMMMFRVFNA